MSIGSARFADHFSAVAAQYADARPEYPPALFAWVAACAPRHERVWEAGCGSGQASRGLAPHFREVYATDPSAAQIACAEAPANVRFAVEPGEACGLPDASVDAVCVAQALHWFDRSRFFAECARVLRPGGVLAAWGYQDIELLHDDGNALASTHPLATAHVAFQREIAAYWPAERILVDAAYAGFEWPFPRVEAPYEPPREMRVEWPLARLLGYFSSYSAVKRYREARGSDPVAAAADAFGAAWGDGARARPLRWPLFIHVGRKA